MTLSESDHALLELLLDPRQNYESVAGLLGSSPGAIRSRAAAALGELSGAGGSVSPELADWALGDQGGAGSQLDLREPATAAAAGALVGAIRASFPDAAAPDIPLPRASNSGAPLAGESKVSSPPQRAIETSAVQEASPLPDRVASRIGSAGSRLRTRPRLYGAIGFAVVLAVAVIVGLLVSGGGSEEEPEGSSSSSLVSLRPLERGSDATGEAILVRAGKQAVAQVELRQLTPTRRGESYVVWLYASDSRAYPLARDVVGKRGTLGGPAPVPPRLRPPLDSFGCLDVSLAPDEALAGSLTGRPVATTYVGRSVLRGEIPRAGQSAASGAASRCQRAAD